VRFNGALDLCHDKNILLYIVLIVVSTVILCNANSEQLLEEEFSNISCNLVLTV
jgi:hypothetical protein